MNDPVQKPGAGLHCLSAVALSLLHATGHAAEHGATSASLLRQTPELVRALRPAGEANPQDGPDDAAQQRDDDGDLRFEIRDFVVEGELSADERSRVDAYLAPMRGRRLTLGALQAMRAELTGLLYHDGESLVRVLLPQQTVDHGVVRFEIVRGRIERIVVHNGSAVSTERIERILQGPNPVAGLRDIEARMRLVRALPGVGEVGATLAPGKYTGGTLVTVTVDPGRSLYGTVTIDNAGSPEAGERRVGVAVGINNPLGRGDRLDVMALATPGALQTRTSAGAQTRLARVSYETPVGAGAARVGMAMSQVGYRLGGEFDGLGKGVARVANLYATRPVWRTRDGSLDVGAEIVRKQLEDDRFDGLLRSRRSSTVASLRADGTGAAGQGRWRRFFRYGAALSWGGIAASDIDPSRSEPVQRAHGTFVKFEPAASIAIAPAPGLQLGGQVRGQWASHGLDGSERMGLGGPGAVRAHGLSAAAVDSGAIVSMEASHDVAPNTRVSVFYDGAIGRYRSTFATPARTVNLQGAGIGVGWTWKGVQASLSLARGIGRSREAPRDDHAWVSLGASF